MIVPEESDGCHKSSRLWESEPKKMTEFTRLLGMSCDAPLCGGGPTQRRAPLRAGDPAAAKQPVAAITDRDLAARGCRLGLQEMDFGLAIVAQR